MGYTINGEDKEVDADGYLLEPDFSDEAVQVIAAAVIGGANLAGGIGTASGAIIGAVLIEVIRNSLGLLGINAFWQGVFIGGAILFAVLFDRVRNFRQSE